MSKKDKPVKVQVNWIKLIFFVVGFVLCMTFFFVKFASALPTAVSCFDLDETSGQAMDALKAYNSTQQYGSQGQAGKIGTAYNYNPVANNYTNFSTSFGVGKDIASINAWVYLPNNSLKGAIIHIGNGAKDGFGFGVGDGNYGVSGNKLTGMYQLVAYHDTGAALGTGWVMITDVVDEAGISHYYINGTSVYNSSGTNMTLPTSWSTFGAIIDGTNLGFGGSVDLVRVYNEKLTPADINTLFNNGVGVACVIAVSNLNVNLTYPPNNFNITNGSLDFYATVTDDKKVQNVSLYLNGVLNETNTSNVNGTYHFNKIMGVGSFNWSILAFDNDSNSNQSATRTFTSGIYENSRTYLTSITEGSVGTFILNISTGYPITSAYLNYNGTLYSTIISAASSYTTITSSMSIPLVNAINVIPLYWSLTYSGGTWNSTSSNQTIYNFNIDNCSINSLTFINFTLKDEVSQAQINGTAVNSLGKINLQVFPFADRTQFYNYSTVFNKTNPFALCFNSTLFSGEKYSFDLEVEYSADDYTTEFYHIQNETLNNAYYNTNISLYPIADTLAKIFKIVYKDSSYRAVDDAIIKIYRKYTGDTDPWKITEIPITDYNGETTANLQESNVVYSFYVYKYGVLLSSFENVFVKCQYSSVDQCTLYINAFASGIDVPDLEDNADFNFTLGYNKTTRVVSSTFVIPSGTSHLISLVVSTTDAIEKSVCTNSLTSSSGTVSCTIPNTFGNSTIIARLYKDGVFQSYGNIKLDQDPNDIYSGVLVILGLFVLFSLIGASITGNPVIMIVCFLIGVIALVFLNLISNNGFIGATASVLFLIIAIVIILIKIGRRN